MKKILYCYPVIAFFFAVVSLVSCEDVPMPYDMPTDNTNSGTTGDYYLNEKFSSGFGVFTVQTVTGTPWVIDYSVATGTGYDSSSGATTASESYLVSPEIDLSAATQVYLQFDYIYRYGTRSGAVDKVLITSSYTGDATTTSWTDITGTLTEGSDWTTFSTYSVDIPSAFIGKGNVVVALYFACTTSSATWEVKNLVMADGTATESSASDGTAGSASGSGTADDPYNVYAALQLISALSSSDAIDDIYVEGIVVPSPSVDTSYGNATYYISDDGTSTNELMIYRGYYLDNAKFTSTDQLQTGDKVVVYGKFVNYYGNTPEGATGATYIYSLDRDGSTGGNDNTSGKALSISGNVVTLTNLNATPGTETLEVVVNDFGLANAASAVGTYTLSDGSTLTVAQGNGATAPTYYSATNGFRIYASNTLTFECGREIASIVMVCDIYNGTYEVGNETATVDFTATGATYCNYNAANSGGTQLRVQTFTITYAQ